MKKIFLGIIAIVISVYARSQEVTVVDRVTRFGIGGVQVFAKGVEDTLETNSFGEVSLDIFPDNVPIVFRHPFYESVVTTKKKIEKTDWLVFMPRGPQLLAAYMSLLNTKEYSYGLPFFVKIVNWDYKNEFLDENQGAGEKIMFKTDEKGITVFRSVESNKILLALDGLRLNNAISKNGKLESTIRFENANIQSVQKIFDPTFLIYGPDGLGGVIHYFTDIPVLSSTYKPLFHYETIQRYETATHSWVSNYKFSYATHNFSSLTSLTYSKNGDIMSGRNRQYLPKDDSLYGLLLYQVKTVNGRDTLIKNPEPLLQKGTAYTQFYFLQKFRFKLNLNINFFSSFHYIHTSDLGIYSGLTEINRHLPRFAVCDYLPVDKMMWINNLYVRKKTHFFDFASFLLAGQYIEEYRLTRKYQNPVELHQIEHLYVGNLIADFVKLYHTSRLAYGIQYTYNNLHSNAYFRNILTDSSWQGLTRYPTDGSESNWLALYAHYRNLSNSNLFFDLAGRFEVHSIWAKFSNKPPQLSLPFQKIDTFYVSNSLSASLDAYPIPGLEAKLTLTKATHIPIIDEFAKVMFKDFVTVIPTNSLLPEDSYYVEWLNTLTFNENVRLQFVLFNSYIHNFIMLVDTTLNGNDSLYLGIDSYNLATRKNIKKVRIYGLTANLNFSLQFDKSREFYLRFSSVFNYSKGKNLTNSLPVPNIAPVFGTNTLKINYKNFALTFMHIYNGLKPRSELSPIGEDYIEKAAKEGFLPWQVYNILFRYKYKNYTLKLGVNNIFDVFFRPYASAINGAGRNFVFVAKISF